MRILNNFWVQICTQTLLKNSAMNIASCRQKYLELSLRFVYPSPSKKFIRSKIKKLFERMSSNEVNTNHTPKPEVIDLRTNTEDIEKLFVSQKTTGVYIGTLIRFMVWLLDNQKQHIEPPILENLVDFQRWIQYTQKILNMFSL